MTAPDIYLAGPDIFYPDAEARYAALEALCAARGLKGVRPSDGGMSAHKGQDTPRELASRIYVGNVTRIQQCAAVVANLSPFRGVMEPDSGTVFEVGMAIALGKPVAVYLPQADRDMASRLQAAFGTEPMPGQPGAEVDRVFGAMVEDFGLPLNLMLACSTSMHTSPALALDALAERLKRLAYARQAEPEMGWALGEPRPTP